MEHAKRITPDDAADPGKALPDRSDLAKLYPTAKPPRPMEKMPTDAETAQRARRMLFGKPLRLALGFPLFFLALDYLITVYLPASFASSGPFSFLPVLVISVLFSGLCFFLLVLTTVTALGKLNLGSVSYLALYLFCLLPAWLPLRALCLGGFIEGYSPSIGNIIAYILAFAALGGGIFIALGLLFTQVSWSDKLRATVLAGLVVVCFGAGVVFGLATWH